MRALIAAAFAFAAAGAAVAAPVHHAPARHRAPAGHSAAATAARDWSRVVTATPAGGYLMGNPAAPVKLVEYGSLSCPHCAAFEAEGAPTLLRYVRSGKMSWEFRTYMLFPTDGPASLLLHCAGAGSFFPLSQALYAQRDWVTRVVALPESQIQPILKLPMTRRVERLARISQLDLFFRRHGMAPARIQSCLADKAGLDRLGRITERGQQLGVTGTPSFLINNVLAADTYDWAALAPQLAAVVH